MIALQFSAILQALYNLSLEIVMSQTYRLATLNRDKKFLIWNFMEELLDKYHEASRKNSSTVFAIRDFKSTTLPVFTLGDQFILGTLREYEHKKGFIRIDDDETVTFTIKGLLQTQKIRHDWD